MMEAASSCEVSEHFFQTEWHNILKDTNLQYMGLTEAMDEEGTQKFPEMLKKFIYNIRTSLKH